MSAYIVNDLTINRILTFLDGWDFGFDTKLKSKIESLSKKIEEEKLKEIGLKLLKLNCESVARRYNEPINKKRIKEYEFFYAPCSIEQAFMHLCCLTYQSCEGDCNKKRLYKVLEDLEDCIRESIVFKVCNKLKCEWEAQEKDGNRTRKSRKI